MTLHTHIMFIAGKSGCYRFWEQKQLGPKGVWVCHQDK